MNGSGVSLRPCQLHLGGARACLHFERAHFHRGRVWVIVGLNVVTALPYTLMNLLYVAIVVSAWSSNPLLRRAFIDRVGDTADGSATFVVWNAIAGAGIALISTATKAAKLAPVGDTPLLGIVLGTASLGVLSTYLMNILLAADNPGYVICAVSGTNNIVVYVLGTLFYGRLSGIGLLGAALIGAGIALITHAKQVPVD